jgi:hypothetical protein
MVSESGDNGIRIYVERSALGAAEASLGNGPDWSVWWFVGRHDDVWVSKGCGSFGAASSIFNELVGQVGGVVRLVRPSGLTEREANGGVVRDMSPYLMHSRRLAACEYPIEKLELVHDDSAPPYVNTHSVYVRATLCGSIEDDERQRRRFT